MDKSKERGRVVGDVIDKVNEICEKNNLDLHEVAVVLAAVAGSCLLGILEQIKADELKKYQEENKESYVDGYIKLFSRMTKSFVEVHKDKD